MRKGQVNIAVPRPVGQSVLTSFPPLPLDPSICTGYTPPPPPPWRGASGLVLGSPPPPNPPPPPPARPRMPDLLLSYKGSVCRASRAGCLVVSPPRSTSSTHHSTSQAAACIPPQHTPPLSLRTFYNFLPIAYLNLDITHGLQDGGVNQALTRGAGSLESYRFLIGVSGELCKL